MDRPAPPARRTLLVLSFLAVCIIWGSTYLGIRITLESFPPFFISAIRFIGAGAVLFVMARVRGEPSPTRAEWGAALVTGSLFFVVGNGLVNVAEQSVSSGLASVLVATMPLWTTLFARVFGTPVSRREAAGVVLGLVGVVVLNLGGELRASPGGAICALLAPMGWGLGSVASQRLQLPKGMMRTSTQMMAGGAATLVVSLALGERVTAAPSFRAVAAAVYLCIFGSLIGFTAYSYLLRHTRPAVATSYAYVNPVIAVALGVAFAGESFGPMSVIGATIVLAAVALVGLARSRKAAVPAQQAAPPALAVEPADSTAGE